MNGRVSKKLRKQAFGDKATKATARRYHIVDGTRFCSGERATYQDLKKDYYRGE